MIHSHKGFPFVDRYTRSNEGINWTEVKTFIPETDAENAARILWIREHVVHRVYVRDIWSFYFSEAAEAVLFKLAWGR